MKLYTVAILGATGAVGREMLKVLEERDFPIGELRLLASARSVGKVIEFKGEKISVQEACPTAQVSKFQSAQEALRFLENNQCDVAFLDIHMRGCDGLTLAKKLKDLNPRCNIIFVTGYSEYAAEALSMHASGYIIKPVGAEAVQTELEDLRRSGSGRHQHPHDQSGPRRTEHHLRC